MAEIDNLSISITANASNAIHAIDNLASSAGRLRSAATGAAGGTQNLANAARDAGETTAEAGTQSGNAARHVRNFGKEAEDAGKSAKKGTAGISGFWDALKRIAYYRFVRTILKEIGAAFKEGITNLYHWSDAVNGHFASSMDRLATSTQYFKNSLGAMFAPLIESFIPILDVIIDRIVDVMNFFNMLVSAISGADTYTVAKKAAAVWDDSANKTKKSAKSAAKELKRTILGFDEINKLVKPTTSSGSGGSSSGKKTPNYGAMFEEKPLEGFFKKISDVTKGWPDWLKALLSVGTAGLAIFGIPALLKKIWSGLKKLFSLDVPNWFKWLFGPKGNGDDGGNGILDDIKLPDGDIAVNLHKGDWGVLDELKMDPLRLPVNVAPQQSPQYIYDVLKRGWDLLRSRTLYVNLAVSQSAQYVFDVVNTNWGRLRSRTLYVNVAVSQSPAYLFDTLKKGWNNLRSVTLYVNVATTPSAQYLFDTLKKNWNAMRSHTLYVSVAISQSPQYIFDTLKKGWQSIKSRTLYVNVAASQTGKYLYDMLKKSWNSVRSKTLYVNVAISQSAQYLYDTVKKGWNNIGDKTLTVNVQPKTILPTTQKETNVLNWLIDESYKNGKRNLDYVINLVKNGWNSVSGFLDENFGSGSSGTITGGGGTRGGGAGRRKHYGVDVDISKGWYGSALNYLGLSKRDLGTTATVSLYKNWWGSALSALNLNNLETTVKVGVTAKKGSGVQLVSSGGAGGKAWVLQTKALGGILANGIWHNIPQYAGGTTNAGSLFVAGESGPEIVGNVNGRTEVLNKSQIAAAMYSAVRSAMAPASANFAAAAANMAYGSGSDENMYALMEMVREGSEATMRQNELLREQNEYLRQINDKDFTAEISTSSITRGMQRTNRRAGTTVMPVGT